LVAAANRSDLRSAVTIFIIAAIAAVTVLCLLVLFGFIPHLRIVPDDTKFDFMRFRRISFPASAVLSIVALLFYLTHGLNFGIDVKGGTLIEVQSRTGAVDMADMRTKMEALGLGEIQLQQFGDRGEVLIRISQQPGGEQAQQDVVSKV